VRFHVGDIFGDLRGLGEFQQIFTNRCLINLPELDLQIQAVENLASLLGQDGQLVLLECSQQAQQRLNELRETVGLYPINYHWHNLHLDEPKFLERLPTSLELVATKKIPASIT